MNPQGSFRSLREQRGDLFKAVARTTARGGWYCAANPVEAELLDDLFRIGLLVRHLPRGGTIYEYRLSPALTC